MPKEQKQITKSNSLSVSKLMRLCPIEDFNFKSTEKLGTPNEIIGQDRAIHALEFGLDIKHRGYNIFAVGHFGTGKATTIKKYLAMDAKNKPTPCDWLYINNFEDSNKPKSLSMPTGKGREFREDMEQFVIELKTEVPKAFDAESYERERENIEKKFQVSSDETFRKLAKQSDEKGFRLVQTPEGFAVLPIVDGNILTPEKHAKLTPETRKKMKEDQDGLVSKVHEGMRQIEQMQKESRRMMYELDQRIVSFAVSHLVDSLKEKYKEYKDILSFLSSVHEHLLKNVQAFKQIKQGDSGSVQERILMMGGNEPVFEEYRVNLVVDNSKTEGAPVIFEKNPSGPNIVGRVEQQGWMGALITNFRMIKSGALHRANGGYLIIDVLDLFKKPYAWEMLKRALKNQEIVIESMSEVLGAFSTRTLEPMPIPLDIKVILIGNSYYYHLIHEYDPEFKELFKVKADFADHMDRNADTANQYAKFISMVCKEENLKHFSPSGVAKIVEHGSRLAAHQNKITTKFGDIVDLVRQSCYFASTKSLVTDVDVKKALSEKDYRSNRIEKVMQEMIEDKTIKISTKGEVVGQINGISVLSLGDYSFGKPSRITVKTYVGSAGLISIEREIEMGGPIHNKATMIIAGYFGGKYAKDFPLSFSASITFEQLYDGVEGDSASAAEIYALVSSLSGLPIRQDLAITGSVNQHGEIQAIGGVNEKIEGVYSVCKMFGLTGTQGVIIPESNVQHLMLNEEVIEACKAGKFSIYAISTIDEGMELLMGKEAGEVKPDGTYQKGTCNFEVQKQIIKFGKAAKAFTDQKDKKKSKK